MGGLVHFDERTLHIGLLGFRPDDAGVSFTVCWVSCSLGDGCTTDDDVWSGLNNRTMCRGSDVKNLPSGGFQLESLILAQNERWRQA